MSTQTFQLAPGIRISFDKVSHDICILDKADQGDIFKRTITIASRDGLVIEIDRHSEFGSAIDKVVMA